MSLIAQRNKVQVKATSGQNKRPGPLYQMVGGRLITISDNGQSYITKGYNVNDIVYSIINLILDKVRVAPWAIYKVKDESSLKALHAIQRKQIMSAEDYRLAKDLSIKAMEVVQNPGKLGELLKYPNDHETFGDFVANGSGYKLLTGNRCIYGPVLEAGANQGYPEKLCIMPSQFVQILCTGGFPSTVTGYEMSVAGLTGPKGFRTQDVFHEKYMNYDWSVNGIQHWGIPPLKAALRRINRSNSAIDASAAKLQNGGVEAIVFVDDDRMPPEDAQEQARAVKTQLINEWTGPENWGKIVSSGYKMGVEQLGLTPVELAIIESEKWDMRSFCNVFGVPSQMMNDPDHKSYNTAKEGEKALTNRCALPLLTSFRDNFNRKLYSDWGLKGERKGWLVDFDMTVYTELQQDIKDMMDWIKPLLDNGFPMNRALELLNIEKIDDKLFDEPWVRPAMGTPLSEWNMGVVDNALNNDPNAAKP
jgi:HK97 family phage portal protein